MADEDRVGDPPEACGRGHSSGGGSGNLALMGGLTASRPMGDSRSEHEGTPSLERGTPIVPPRKLEDAKTWIGFYKYPE